jgi:histone H2A
MTDDFLALLQNQEPPKSQPAEPESKPMDVAPQESPVPVETPQEPPSEPKTEPTKPKRASVSQSKRAGLILPVGRVARYLKRRHKGPVSAGAAVYLTAVMEYMTAEMLDISGTLATNSGRKRIDNRSLYLTLQGDEDMQKLFYKLGCIIPGGGVVPNPALWTKKQK